MAAPGDSGVEEVILFSTLSILQLIKDAQQQHGLRHGDYQRYRAYCARRLRRVRKSLRFCHAHKSVPRHPAKFAHRSVNAEIVSDIRFLYIPLWEAERAWAHAMQLKQELGAEGPNPRRKFHMLSKLRKAIQHSSLMESLCKTLHRADPPTKLEAQAYNAWIHGCYYFEKQDWQKAKDSFTAAKIIYEKLSLALKSNEALSEAYKARCAEMAPQLRFCAYSLGGDVTAVADLMEMRLHMGEEGAIGSDLDQLIAETLEKQQTQAEQRAEAEWAGQTISLDRPKKVHQFHMALKQFDHDIGAATPQAQVGMYEKLLLECRDAIQSLRDEAKTEKSGGADGVDSYLTYVRLGKTVEKYLVLIDQTTNGEDGGKKNVKPADLVRLYDSVIQNLVEMQSLPGVDKDRTLSDELVVKVAYFKAFRCFYVGAAYDAARRWPHAWTLYERTLAYAAEARHLLERRDDPIASMVGPERLELLASDASAAKFRAQANSVCAADSPRAATNSSTPNKPLLDDLETYRKWNLTELTNNTNGAPLIQLPPDFAPMPCKPLFFDLALNHVKFPDLESKIEVPPPTGGPPQKEGAKSEQQPPSQGLGGLVKGWFWGSK